MRWQHNGVIPEDGRDHHRKELIMPSGVYVESAIYKSNPTGKFSVLLRRNRENITAGPFDSIADARIGREKLAAANPKRTWGGRIASGPKKKELVDLGIYKYDGEYRVVLWRGGQGGKGSKREQLKAGPFATLAEAQTERDRIEAANPRQRKVGAPKAVKATMPAMPPKVKKARPLRPKRKKVEPNAFNTFVKKEPKVVAMESTFNPSGTCQFAKFINTETSKKMRDCPEADWLDGLCFEHALVKLHTPRARIHIPKSEFSGEVIVAI